MPIPTTVPATKFSCKSCNWSIIRPQFTSGDCLSPLDMRLIHGITECPKCESKEIVESSPSFFDMLNIRKIHHDWDSFTSTFDWRFRL